MFHLVCQLSQLGDDYPAGPAVDSRGMQAAQGVVEFCESESRSWVEEESGASISVIELTRNTPPKQSKNALLACYLFT